MKVYDGIMQGLEEAIAHNGGKIKARTNTMSIEPVPDFESNRKNGYSFSLPKILRKD